MKQIVKYFITYPVWANTLMFCVLIIGYLAMRNMNTSFFPEVETNRITISIVYPGTSPEEIEESLVLKIENNLKGTPGIDRTTSVSRENNARVTVEVLDNYDADEVYDDVKNAVDRVTPYPGGAEKPIIKVSKFRSRTVTIALYGNADLWALKERAVAFRDDLLAKDGISQVTLAGIPNREIAVTLSEENLRRYGLSFTEVSSAIASANVDISGGSIKTPDEKLLIRSYERRDFAHEVRSIAVRTSPDGTAIRVGDVAQIKEQWEDSPNATFYNNQRAILINIDKTLEEDIIEISTIVQEYVPVFSAKHPEVSLKIVSDRSEHLRERIKLLVRNGMIGFVLVVLVLGFFLNVRMSFWVAIGIPISFAGMFIIANLWGITINVISLMGMIIVVGILVDDAIVVAENIYQKSEKGMSATKAAVTGLFEVIAPVFTAVTTTIFAFIPFFFFLGTMGRIIYQLALVVIGALIFSLVESFLILPAHLAHSKGLSQEGTVSSIRSLFERMYRWLTEKVYGPALRWALNNCATVIAIAVGFIILTLGLLRGQIVEVSNFPAIDRNNVTLSLTMTTGTREQVTDSILQQIEAKIWKANERLKNQRKDKEDVILSIQREIGSNRLGDAGGHAGSLRIELLEGGKRKMWYYKVAGLLRKEIGTIPGSQKLSFSGGHWGKAINISLLSNDLDQLDKAKRLLKEKLAEYPTLTDITDSDIEGWREVRIKLKPAAYMAGLTISDIAGQVRQGFFGKAVQRFQRGEDEIRVWVRYTDEDRTSLGKLENMYLRGKSGSNYPLSAVADYKIERGRVTIAHLDGRREVRVEADLVDPEMSPSTILSDIKQNTIPGVISQVKDVYVSYEGRERHNAKFLKSLRTSFPPALLGIAIILVLVFRSYLQGLIIFLMIPLGLAGAVWGHLFHGFMISRLSMFGLIALAGIVINDSIVFIDRINRNLKEGLAVTDAIYKAGLSRLRPIILTTITTVVGMAPLIMETSRQAQFLIPMAVSICYGLIFGSLFILFLVPALFRVLNRARFSYDRLFDKNATPENVEPAVRELNAERSVEE
jgi:multidrug efflux pump subunit AcrB